jgi:lysophospholipase L1-like esterase
MLRGAARVTAGRSGGRGYHRAMPRVPLAAACAALLLSACGTGGDATVSSSPTASAPAATASLLPPPPLRTSVRIPVAGRPPVSGEPWYLAIGDSVTFGFTMDPARSGMNSAWALQLQGLLAGAGRPWHLYDTACPSETLSTYTGSCPLRRLVPDLATRSQHDVALAAIAAHRSDLRLILVDLGSNDLLHAGTLDASQVIPTLINSLTRIVTELQSAAPGVPVVLCNYYDPLENLLPTTVAPLEQVNAAVADLATRLHTGLADFFSAVNSVPPPDPDLGRYVDLAHDDIHPTVAGHTALAQAALRVVLART